MNRLGISLFAATVLFQGMVPSIGLAHQSFRVTSPEAIPAEPEPPILADTASYSDADCSIYKDISSTQFYALPTKLSRIPSSPDSLLGAALESERQDHIVVVLVHGVDRELLDLCVSRFAKTAAISTAKVSLYPFEIVDVSLISDPNDHLVVKFNFAKSYRLSFRNNPMLMTIIQSSARRNVRTLKKALFLKFDAVAAVRLRVQNSSGTIEYRTLTIPITLGNIGLSSQGL